jgi:hypothetical protein
MGDRAYTGSIRLVEKGKPSKIVEHLIYTISLGSLDIYANNAAAVAGGLAAGDLYRTNGDPDTICVVH